MLKDQIKIEKIKKKLTKKKSTRLTHEICAQHHEIETTS
jgi:hypothetical protein